ncbi:hypothetical protein [Lignipirellula cremea]|uniref:Uncharacterized protein n=1 Tax=Lignipirellula cremea TaxID=2528010 RepID=A0A518DLM4_9BACT|nr:hypothetical protein [Lignipirellula cremea]QDU92733.1 hypothetical protein Pla8534_04820 [Lignipirellula cremea]
MTVPTRPLLALTLGVAILGLVKFYMVFQASIPSQQLALIPPAATGKFRVDVTLTFATSADQFALSDDSSGLQVRLAGSELYRAVSPLPAGEVLTIDDPPIVVGKNEIWLKAVPADTQDFGAGPALPADDGFGFSAGEPAAAAPDLPRQLSHAVRIRVQRDQAVLVDTTLWSDRGAPVEGTVPFTVPPLAKDDTHE